MAFASWSIAICHSSFFDSQAVEEQHEKRWSTKRVAQCTDRNAAAKA